MEDALPGTVSVGCISELNRQISDNFYCEYSQLSERMEAPLSQATV